MKWFNRLRGFFQQPGLNPTYLDQLSRSEEDLIRRLEYVESHTRFAPDVTQIDRLILADAQTSGGLLIAVPPEREAQLCEALHRNDTLVQAVIGELTSGEPGTLRVER